MVQNPNLPNCVIFDIDGTLAHKGNRNPYDWSKVGEDTVDKAVSNLYNLISNVQKNTIICTGRDGICEKETKKWINLNLLWHPQEFHIRNQGDQRPDWVVKREMWEDISTRYNILYMVDDRNQVVDYARSLGLKVFQVQDSNF